MHWLPKARAPSVIRSGLAIAPELIETLSAPARSVSRMSSAVRIPPPTVSGMKHSSATAETVSSIVSRPSAEGRETTLATVSAVADEVFIPLTVGGGIRTTEDIKETLRAGADKVSINTGAIERRC